MSEAVSQARNPLFQAPPDAAAQAFTASARFDWRLLPYDLQGSRAHVRMLGACGILPLDHVEQIVEGLDRIEREWRAGTFVPRPEWEDVHMHVEGRLRELIGPVAGELHTARSRNDQVQTDMLLYLRDVTARVDTLLAAVAGALLDQAEAAGDVVIPGYTHLQAAQPVLLAHHWLAYVDMLERDRDRLHALRRHLDRSPLGAGALSGTPYPTDPQLSAALLGFADTYRNSIDAVADRDYLLEFLAFAAILMVHLSRLAEELVLWSSVEFGFVRMDDRYSTGSSIMPQKRNPDVAELVRGKSGRVFGNLMGLLTVMKGLPLAYDSDMQEDKEATFEVVDTLEAVLEVTAGMVRSLRIERERIRARLGKDYTAATDLADLLVAEGMPFRDAHHLVGRLVGELSARGLGFSDVDAALLAELGFSALKPEWFAQLDPRWVVARRRQPFSTGPAAVAEALAQARRRWQG